MREWQNLGRLRKRAGSKGLSLNLKKIIWTDKSTLGKQMAAVVSITVVLGVIIVILDSLVLQFMNLVIK